MGIVGAVAGLLIGAVLAYVVTAPCVTLVTLIVWKMPVIPVHELGSTSEANDAFMLLRTMGAPDGDVKSAGASGVSFCPVLTAVLSTCTRCCSVFCLPSTHVSPITLRFVTL